MLLRELKSNPEEEVTSLTDVPGEIVGIQNFKEFIAFLGWCSSEAKNNLMCVDSEI